MCPLAFLEPSGFTWSETDIFRCMQVVRSAEKEKRKEPYGINGSDSGSVRKTYHGHSSKKEPYLPQTRNHNAAEN